MEGVVAFMPRKELTEAQKMEIWTMYLGMLAQNGGNRPPFCIQQLMLIFGKSKTTIHD